MTIPPLTILACGMTTAVGLTAPASCAAIRARLDGFRETRFMARGGEWIVGAEVPLEEPWRGIPRLARMLEGPLRECLAATDLPPEQIPLFLCTAEPDRPGRFEGLDTELLAQTQALLGATLRPALPRRADGPRGRAPSASARRAASSTRTASERVIVAGVDTYLVAATLARLRRAPPPAHARQLQRLHPRRGRRRPAPRPRRRRLWPSDPLARPRGRGGDHRERGAAARRRPDGGVPPARWKRAGLEMRGDRLPHLAR